MDGLKFVSCCFLFFSSSFLPAEEFNAIPQEHIQMMEERPYKVLGLGGACLVDLLLPVTHEFLSTVPGRKGGAEEINFDLLSQIISNSGVTPVMATGGSCTNTLKGLSSLGIGCALLGKIGKGEWGEFFLNTLHRLNIVPLLTPASTSSACVLCLITPDAQRTMRFYEGCSREMTPSFLHPDYVNHANWIHIEGYALRNQGVVKRMLELAKEANVPVSLDLSCFEIAEEYRSTILDFFEKGYIHTVFANEDELLALTGLNPLEGCVQLQKWCSISVVLRGSKGALICDGTRVIESKAETVSVVDTTGAGDLFASGFLYGYLEGYSLEQCAYFGNLLGGTVVGVIGAEIPESKWDLLRGIVNEQRKE